MCQKYGQLSNITSQEDISHDRCHQVEKPPNSSPSETTSKSVSLFDTLHLWNPIMKDAESNRGYANTSEMMHYSSHQHDQHHEIICKMRPMKSMLS